MTHNGEDVISTRFISLPIEEVKDIQKEVHSDRVPPDWTGRINFDGKRD